MTWLPRRYLTKTAGAVPAGKPFQTSARDPLDCIRVPDGSLLRREVR
jgi:hypothetical protein